MTQLRYWSIGTRAKLEFIVAGRLEVGGGVAF